jgi:hypothetical protein
VVPKLRLVVAVAALAATVPIGGAGADTIPGVPCNTASRSGAWQTFKAPLFLQANGLDPVAQEITAYAVAPSKPTLVAVTNGNSIQVSTNGGCTWQQRLRLDQIPADSNVPLSGRVTRIRGLYILPRTNRIIALAEELSTTATVGRPHVIYSDTGNATDWHVGDAGLPPVGQPLLIRAHPGNPNIVYLSFANAKAPEGGVSCPQPPLPCIGGDDNGTPGLLWWSINGGRDWSRRTDPNDLNGASVIRYFAVEDDDPSGRTIWVVSNGALRKSTDGGASFATPDSLNQAGFNFTAVESINRTTGKNKNPVKVMAFSSGGEMMRLEEGKGWIRSRVPFNAVESVAQRPEGDIIVATSPAGGGVNVYRIYGNQLRDFELTDPTDPDNENRYKLSYGWQPISPSGITVAAKASSSVGGGVGTYFLRDRQRILRFLGTSTTRDSVIAPPELTGAPPRPLGKITPPNLNLTLPVGKEKVVDYTLTLPPAPTPIDLYLLVDNSGSMQPLIDELKRSLGDVAVGLVKGGVDVRIGVGQINVQPDKQTIPIDNPETEEIDESKPKPIYQRLRAVGPVDADLFRALSKIDGYGGSGDETQLESLYQAATGDGYEARGLGALVGYNVPRGQDAGFRDRPDLVKIIVHATDEAFSKDIEGAHNDPALVARVLRDAGIRQIGLSQGVQEAHKDLSEMARLTNAVAPPGGVDCDGNGRPDIRAGEALVCEQNYGLDKTLVNLIRSLEDPQDLTLQVTKGATLKAVSDRVFTINAKSPTSRKFKVTYSCKGVAPGIYTTDLRADLRDYVVAKATATVNCGNVPPGQKPPLVGPPAQQPPPVQPQPVPAPIAPVQPVPQPQTQVNAQSQVNPQTGAARQKQHQLQVALAENDLGIQDEDQLAMVGISAEERAVAPATAVVIAGMVMASACGGAFAFRRRTQLASARVR